MAHIIYVHGETLSIIHFRLQLVKKSYVDHIAWRTKRPEDVEQFAHLLQEAGTEVKWVEAGVEAGQGRAIRFKLPSEHRFEIYYDMEKTLAEPSKRSVLKNQTYKSWARGVSPRRIDHVNILSSLKANEISPPSSQSLIAADLEAGTISQAQSLLYRAWALFWDPRLPERYDGAGSVGEDNGLFRDIAAVLPTLPADQAAELEPFLLRPTDPRSAFSADDGRNGCAACRFHLHATPLHAARQVVAGGLELGPHCRSRLPDLGELDMAAAPRQEAERRGKTRHVEHVLLHQHRGNGTGTRRRRRRGRATAREW